MTTLIIKIDDVGLNIQQEGTDDMNKITGLISGQFGKVVPLTVVDEEGTATDLSAYTAVLVRAISPDARTTLSFTGAFVSATGGQISFTPSSINTFDRDGTWEGQVQFSDTGVLALTVIFDMEVEKKI